jgi:hypothetical protein
LVIERSAVGTNESVSVAELLPAAGSVVPTATTTVAVLANEPVAVDAMVAVRVNVAVPLGNRSIVALMLPLPDTGHVEPAEAEHVHVAPDRDAGTVSVTVEPIAADGPALDATIVYVTDVPGISVALPSVLVMETSARRVMVVVSVAELLAGVGSVDPPGRATAAVFDNVPVAVEMTVALTENVAVPPARRLTEAEMLPEPDAGQLEPTDAEHVQVAPDKLAGNVSVTVALVMADGPAFDVTIVYVSPVPALMVTSPSVLVIDRSAVGVRESVSVATLLAELVSTTPAGAEMVTELASEPVAVDDTATITV